jgi:hypothetical protein
MGALRRVAVALGFSRPDITWTAIAAPPAALAQMIRACIFCAIDADSTRRFAADGAGESENFHKVIVAWNALHGQRRHLQPPGSAVLLHRQF